MKGYILVLSLFLLFGCMEVSEEPQENITPEQPSVTCTDSDGGVQELVKGTVDVDGVKYEDNCIDSLMLREFHCRDKALAATLITCSQGYACENGACVPKPEENVTVEEPDCQDTDSGKDYTTAGSVTYQGMAGEDVCQGNFAMIEYYCENDEMKQETHNCEVGELCQGGACIPQERSCTDTDEGDELAAGTVTVYGGGAVVASESDDCVDDELRLEYYCENGDMKSITSPCPADTYCFGGACVPKCRDADGGKDYDTSSTASDMSGSYRDYCSSDIVLMEYYCSNNIVLTDVKECDYYCFDGRCLTDYDVKCKEYDGDKTVRLEYDDEVIEEYNDYCFDSRGYRDYLCISGEVEYDNEVCDDNEICYDARCLEITEETCYDLDETAPEGDIHVKSVAVETWNDSIKEEREDYCLNDKTLVEYMCDADDFDTEFITCPGEEKCVDGICVYPYTCSDTDGGQSLVPGEVSLKEGSTTVRTERDSCADEDTVFEVFCTEDHEIQYIHLNCPAGTTCDPVNGSCK